MSALNPAAPATNSLDRKSFQVLTAAVCQPTQTLTSLPTLPSQVNFRPSNFAAALPINGSSGTLRLKCAMVEPSFGADVVKIIRRRQAAGARTVHRQDRRIARNVLADVARDRAAVGVVGIRDRKADDDRQRMGFVEFLGAFRAGGAARHLPDERSREREADEAAGTARTRPPRRGPAEWRSRARKTARRKTELCDDDGCAPKPCEPPVRSGRA